MLEEALRQTNEYRRLREALAGGRSPVALFGLPPAARAQTAAALAADLGRPAVVLTAGEAAATRFAADAAFFGARSAVCPARDFALRPTLGQSREFEYRRIAVLGSIVGGRCNLLAAPLEGALQLTMPRADFETNTLTLKEGQTFKQQELVARLVSAGYHRRDKVEGPGQFSVCLLYTSVAGKGNAGAAAHAAVAESHLLHVDGGAPLVGDLVHLAVDVGAGRCV